MKVRWLGHSAFLLGGGGRRVAIDPWGDTESLGSRGVRFDYPRLEGLDADLLLISHEHMDHNGAEAVAGDPHVIRAAAGTFESEVAKVVGSASEHDRAAGTERGQNTIFALSSTVFGSATWATSGRRGCGTSRRQRSAGPTCCSSPSGAGPRSAPSRRPRSCG